MKHKHFWILDKNSFGKCKYPGCTATKQFPIERRLILRPSEIAALEGKCSEVAYDPDGWLNASAQDFERGT